MAEVDGGASACERADVLGVDSGRVVVGYGRAKRGGERVGSWYRIHPKTCVLVTNTLQNRKVARKAYST